MYSCGPTVYNDAHIGNFRSVIMYDLVRRSFEYLGYEVKQVMNITDVDDKIIARAKEENRSSAEISKKYEKIFLNDLDKLNVLRPTIFPHATEYIADMIKLIEDLLARDFAYKIDSGPEKGIYMKVSKVSDYGILLGKNGQEAIEAAQQSEEGSGNVNKQDPRDFALWKFYTEDDGDVVFDASFGRGRPGWHIECSAMAMKALGQTFDIHSGGADMIFPHHTNEIAQSQSLTGRIPANYWLHYAFVNIAGDKMSKSKKNFYTLKDLEVESVSPLAYRYWLLQAHYRSTVDFTFEAVKASQQALVRLVNAFIELNRRVVADINAEEPEVLARYNTEFKSHIENDFDIPAALATVWKILKDSKVATQDKIDFIKNADKVLGLDLDGFQKQVAKNSIPDEIQALADVREQARKDKDWAKSDALRVEIESRGFVVKDTDNGQEIIKKVADLK